MDRQVIVVTGGAGFIGSNFVRRALTGCADDVLIVDKLTYAGSLATIEDVLADPRVDFVEADIADSLAVAEIFEQHRPRAVVNFAAESHVDRSIDGPRAFIQSNLVGVFELLEAARRLWATLDDEERARFRFLHVSSDEVFGSLDDGPAFSETTRYAPRSPYAASKAGADHLVDAWFETYGLPTLITNCTNNYGPYQFPEKLIPLMILNAVEGRALPVYGVGGNVRDWIHVDDHCLAVLDVLTRGIPGRRYNIGSRNERTNLDVVRAICRAVESLRPAADNDALRASGTQAYEDLIEFVEDRPGHDQRYTVDPSRIESELGWAPRIPFDEGLVSTVRWYLDHETWCREVQAGASPRARLGLGDAR